MSTELQRGRTYRAKRPTESHGLVNDRTILWVGADTIQYDGPSVSLGSNYPKVSKEKFLKWVDRDVTDELPKGEYAPWPPQKVAAPGAQEGA